METVYIETSVISFLTARPSSDPVLAWKQQLTKDWWAGPRELFSCFVSSEVVNEASKGDPHAAALRIAAIRDITLIDDAVGMVQLAGDLMNGGYFPPGSRSDAVHLAFATIAKSDYLLTWNCRHLANAVVLHHIEMLYSKRGLTMPRVCTPEELMAW